MKRLLPILLAVALVIPGTADAAKAKKAKKAKTDVPEWAVESEKCSGDRDVKSVSLGKETIYVSADMRSASFQKDEVHTLKHNLAYYSPTSNYFRRTPGLSPDGTPLVPAFRHGDVWYSLGRDENGTILINGTPISAPVIAPADQAAPKAKKPRKGKKGKKAKKAKKVEETAPATEEKK